MSVILVHRLLFTQSDVQEGLGLEKGLEDLPHGPANFGPFSEHLCPACGEAD